MNLKSPSMADDGASDAGGERGLMSGRNATSLLIVEDEQGAAEALAAASLTREQTLAAAGIEVRPC